AAVTALCPLSAYLPETALRFGRHQRRRKAKGVPMGDYEAWPGAFHRTDREGNMATKALPTIAGCSGGLTRYLEEIRRFPMLEPDQEYMLAKRWREHGDTDAAQELITSHLRLEARIAMGYRGYGLPIGEVISEGNVGLMQAVKRFEPDRGFPLATYAMW